MAKYKWKAQRTLLIVGEGYHDVAFLQHVKSVFVMRGCGLAVTIKNAQGKGASHVVDYAVRQSNNAHYDDVAALFDTDQDWSDAVEAMAIRKSIKTLKSETCLEAMLLRIIGLSDTVNSNQLKERLAKQLTGDATEAKSYSRSFTREMLTKTTEPTIVKLIGLLSSKSESV